MSTGINLVAAALVSILFCVAVSAAAKRPGGVWNYYHFDGRGFVAGQPNDGAYVALRDGALPAVVTGTAKIEAVALPPGKGAVAGICYIQSSGGKLASASGYGPVPRSSVRIVSGGTVVATVQADDQGYFVAVLDSGIYRIGNAPLSVEITVEKNRTTLVPLRVGKRMVD